MSDAGTRFGGKQVDDVFQSRLDLLVFHNGAGLRADLENPLGVT